MAIVYILGGTTNIVSSIKTQGPYPIDALYVTEYLSDLWTVYSGKSGLLYEGLRVYIQNGNLWKFYKNDFGAYVEFDNNELPEGWTYEIRESKGYGVLKTDLHKGEIWVLTNLNTYENPICDFDVTTLQEKTILSPSSGWKRLAYVDDLSEYVKKEDISFVYKYKGSVATENDLPTTGVQAGDVYNVEYTGDNYAWTGSEWDKLGGCLLPKGDELNPHLIWSSDKGWTTGKISILDIELPNNGKENDVLSLNAEGNLIWTSVNLKKELPDYSIEKLSNILVVNEIGNLEWSDVLNWKKL